MKVEITIEIRVVCRNFPLESSTYQRKTQTQKKREKARSLAGEGGNHKQKRNREDTESDSELSKSGKRESSASHCRGPVCDLKQHGPDRIFQFLKSR
jgi:hypothetical protein